MTGPDDFFAAEDHAARDHATQPNGHNRCDALRLVSFDAMQPRLGDGYIIKGLLGSTAMALVFGESGCGKTFFVLHLALCVAAGAKFFGHRVRRCGVVYVAAEAGRSIENRVVAARLTTSLPEKMPFAAITSPVDLCTEAADTDKLIAAIRGADLDVSVELIIVDTLSRVMAGGNENQPDDMGALVSNLDRLREETGAAVVLVHHSGKDTSRGARGHSLLRAAIDTEVEITRDDVAKLCTAAVPKQREYATEGALSFTLRQIELGTDQDGEAVTSCIVVPLEGSQSTRQKHAKLTGAAKVGFEQLKNCMADHADDIPPSKHVPRGAKGVTLDLWRDFLEKAGVVNPKGSPREQFRRISVALQERGLIGVWDNSVWLVASKASHQNA
jgi:hypothetical protein